MSGANSLEGDDLVELQSEPLSVDRYLSAVADDGAGAIGTFIGVTRNTFDGKKVVRLEYEAYHEMVWQRVAPSVSAAFGKLTRGHSFQALQELRGVVTRMRQRWELKKVAVAHRTGVVPVGQASVVIAVSSAHRAAALEATHFAIDDLKATVPIWKKEFYEGEDETSSWKANVS
jgi:molybdopterin synthase catalytic subunit